MNANNSPDLPEVRSSFAGKKITFKEMLIDLPDGTVGVLRKEHSANILNVILCSDGGLDFDLEGQAPIRYSYAIRKQIEEGLITIE